MASSLPVLAEPNSPLPSDLKADVKEVVESVLSRLDDYIDLDDLTELHKQARGLAEYLREHDENGRTMRAAQLRVEKRIGELLAETVRAGNPQLSKDATIGRLPKGITRDQSSKWQKLAGMPTQIFEDYLADAHKPSVTGALRHALRAAGSTEEVETAFLRVSDDLETIVQRGVRFRTILADPAWAYANQGTRGATGNHYRTMPTSEIAALPIEKLAADVAQLHLWATDVFLEDAIAVMKAWGFVRKSMLIWEKPQLGLGNYYRLTHEYLLLGTRGEAQFPLSQRSHRSVIKASREAHSRRPDQFRQLVEQVGRGPRLELFGRREVPGWVIWGNEVERDRLHQGVEELLDAEQVEDSDE